MDLLKCSSHSEECQLYVITSKGYMKSLYVPFQVRCLMEVGGLQANTCVYVEAVSSHYEHKIIFRVLGNWHPFNQFKIKIHF